MDGARSRCGRRRGTYGILVGKPEGKRPLGRPKHRWEDNNEITLLEISWRGTDGINLPEDEDKWWALVEAVMNIVVP
jgi:hypothetical protein